MTASSSQSSDRVVRIFSKKNFCRIGSLTMLFLTSLLLFWGARLQVPRNDPFAAPSFLSWLTEPQPHRAFDEMPMVPKGKARRFVPRGLCVVAEKCGGLTETSTGALSFIDDHSRQQNALRIHRVTTTGSLYAISASGALFGLAEGTPPIWRQILLPEYNRSELSIRVQTSDSGKANCAAFSPDGAAIAIGYEDGNVRVWSSVDGKLLSADAPLGSTPIRAIAFSPSGNELAMATGGGNWAIVPSDLDKSSPRMGGRSEPLYSIQYSPDGARLITTSSLGSLEIWSAIDGRKVKTVGYARSIRAVSVSKDGRRIALVSDGFVSIFEAETGQPVAVLKGHPEANFAAFSPDGSRVVTSSRDGKVMVWETIEGKPSLTFDASESDLAWATFNPDGSQIVTISADAVTFWNSSHGKKEVIKRLSEAPGDWVLLSPDASRIALVTRRADTVGIQTISSRPVLKDVTSAGDGTVWVAGSQGYIAASKDGSTFFTSETGDRNSDLIAVSPLAAGDGVTTLGSDNSLGHWTTAGNRPRETVKQFANSSQTQPAELSIQGVAIFPPKDGAPKLRALSFSSDVEGWVVGDNGIVLRTSDRGLNWTKLYERKGLTLSDIFVEEPSRVGWALGQYDDGHVTVIAANQAAEIAGPDSWQELEHYIAPWYFFFGIPALLLVAIGVLISWRSDPAIPPKSIEEIAYSDSPLRWSDPEAATLKPLARGLSRFLRNVNTQPPLTLAVTGRWGSGKSSLMNLLMTDLQVHGGRAVWFNAWHHREEEHLLAALFETIRREAAPNWWSWPGFSFRARLLWRRTRRTLLNLLYATLFTGIVVFTVRESVPAFHIEELNRMLSKLIEFAGEEVGRTWGTIVTTALAGSGGVALVGLWLRGKLVALPANPAKLVSALSRRASLGDFSDKLAFRQKFGEQFKDVCNALLTRRSAGLVILIDDLDRCQPEDILKVLEAVNYLVWAGPCIIVLGMDRRQIEYCVGLGFEKLVEGLPEEELIYAADETPDKSGKQRAFARHYLEKLINIEVPVPTLDEASAGAMLSGAVKTNEVDPPRWLSGGKRAAANVYQIARVGLIAFLVGMSVTWIVERLRETPSVASSLGAVAKSGGKEPGKTDSPGGGSQESQGTVGPSFQAVRLAHLDMAESLPTREIPSSRRWLWWSPTILLVGLALLFGIAAVVQRRRQIVEDSPAFAKALLAINPLLAAVSATPRGIKRYQNRMRYLAARMRPARYEPDAVDILLNWFGKRIGRTLVPKAWFEAEVQDRLPIPEPALIALGAIEMVAPSAFGNPAELYSILDSGAPRDWFTESLSVAWTKVRTAYAKVGLAMPTVAEYARYASFVQNRTRAAPPAHPAEIVSLHPTPGPRPA